MSRLRYYLDLEKLRCGDKLSYHFEVSSAIDPDHLHIPNMILQPFIENAIWHGIMPAERDGVIGLGVTFSDDGVLVITISDNGVGFAAGAASKTHQSKGMNLIINRLRLLDPTAREPVSITALHPGTRVTVRLSGKMYRKVGSIAVGSKQ